MLVSLASHGAAVDGTSGAAEVEAEAMTKTISHKALMARINRKLAHEHKALRASRSETDRSNLGAFFILDTYRNAVEAWHVDPVECGRDLKVLHASEQVAGR